MLAAAKYIRSCLALIYNYKNNQMKAKRGNWCTLYKCSAMILSKCSNPTNMTLSKNRNSTNSCVTVRIDYFLTITQFCD